MLLQAGGAVNVAVNGPRLMSAGVVILTIGWIQRVAFTLRQSREYNDKKEVRIKKDI